MTEAAIEEPSVTVVAAPPAPPVALTHIPPTHVYERHTRNSLFRKPPPKRRAATRNAAPRRRNAGPAPAPRPRASSSELVPSGFVRLGQSLLAVGTSGASSALGALVTRVGVRPGYVAGGMTGAGVLTAWRGKSEVTRQIGTGLAAAGVSQALLMWMAPTPPKPPAAPAAPAAPAPPVLASAPRRQTADLGSLPPGWLDAAFEQARAEMAAETQHAPPQHHTIPFVP